MFDVTIEEGHSLTQTVNPSPQEEVSVEHRAESLATHELEALVTLSARIFGDYRDPNRKAFELAYVMSETSDNEESAFLKVVELANTHSAHAFGICDGETDKGYPGYEHTRSRLGAFGFPISAEVVRIKTGPVNTRTEAEAVVQYMRGKRGDLAIIAPPFHLVRAFITFVTVAKRTESSLRIYAIPGVSLPWMAQALHSQGELRDTRAGLLRHELERIKRYQEPEFGSLLAPSAVHKYLDWRDW